MTLPFSSTVVDLDQAVFFIYPDSETLKLEYESKIAGVSVKEFMRNKLKELWEEIQETISPMIKEYFWHDEGLHWEIIDRTASPFEAFLHGKVRFGDGMEDEWFLVNLLKRITRRNSSLVASIFDTDGDFILIEAAEVLPEWLEPENSKNRVFIHDGTIKIVDFNTEKEPNLSDALKYIRSSASQPHIKINQIIDDKLTKEALQKLHKARVRVPLKVAKILWHKKQLIGPAISSFYNREPESMRVCAEMPKLNPGKAGGPMVLTTIPMTRIQFAQLACQEFIAPSNDQVDFGITENSTAAELGMKLTCGFEICLSQTEPKFIIRPLFEDSKSVQDEIYEILNTPNNNNFICEEEEDDLSWMQIDEDILDSELKSKLFLDEQDESELIDTWTKEFENGTSKMKGELSEIDKIVEDMKKMIENKSNFEGIVCDNSDDNSDDSSDSENSSDNSDDDELLLEREIFETINFDPDLLMKILEANAHMGVSNEEFLKRFRKYQEENPVKEDRGKTKQKGLADIDEEKLKEARKSSRKPVEEEEGDNSDDNSEDIDTSVHVTKYTVESYADDDLSEVEDDFIYGQTLDQLKKSSRINTEITVSDDETVPVPVSDDETDEKAPADIENLSYEEYNEAMERQLQSELKHYNPDLDETSNLGKSVIEAMMAGKGSGDGSIGPLQTIITGMGAKIPKPSKDN